MLVGVVLLSQFAPSHLYGLEVSCGTDAQQLPGFHLGHWRAAGLWLACLSPNHLQDAVTETRLKLRLAVWTRIGNPSWANRNSKSALAAPALNSLV